MFYINKNVTIYLFAMKLLLQLQQLFTSKGGSSEKPEGFSEFLIENEDYSS
jgi:hypothetical protein